MDLAKRLLESFKDVANQEAARYNGKLIEASSQKYLEPSYNLMQTMSNTMGTLIKKIGSVARSFEGFIKNVFHKDSITNKAELVEQLRSVVYSNSRHIITQGLVALAERSETCSTLEEIKIPTLIICGREDQVTPLVQSEFMNKNIKGSILQVIDNAGHVSNLEQPEEFNKYLDDFLTDLNGIDVLNS